MVMNNFLRLQRFYFHLLGFDLLSDTEMWQNPLKTVWSILSLLTFLPLTIAFGMQNIQNINALTDTLCSVLVDLLAIYKFAMIVLKRGQLQLLIRRYYELLLREYEQSIAHANIIDRESQREQLISGLYTNSFLVAGLLANLLPLMGMLGAHLRSDHVEPLLAFPSVYPWDNRRIHNYLLSYVWNVCAAAGVVFASVCVDTLLCSLTHYSCALFKIAQRRMQHFGGESLRATQARLGAVVALHQECLELAAELNRCFRPLVCAQMLVASLHLCVLSFQVAVNLTQLEVLFYAAFVVAMLTQVLIYCYCGEHLKAESALVLSSICESNWSEANSTRIGRALLITIMRTQLGSHIDGYFFEANLETFVAIVSNAVSYVMLLRSFSK